LFAWNAFLDCVAECPRIPLPQPGILANSATPTVVAASSLFLHWLPAPDQPSPCLPAYDLLSHWESNCGIAGIDFIVGAPPLGVLPQGDCLRSRTGKGPSMTGQLVKGQQQSPSPFRRLAPLVVGLAALLPLGGCMPGGQGEGPGHRRQTLALTPDQE